MLTPIHAAAGRPLSRRGWLAATAGLAFGLAAAAMPANAQDTIKVGIAFARHYGYQRDHAEGRHADAHRRAEQEGRPARREARAVVVDPRSDWPTFAEKARAHQQGQGRRRVRVLDFRFAEIGAAGVQGAQL
jgi:urea transport system substrate-binding protein